MKNKKIFINGLYLLITLIAFSLSLFKFDNPVWIAAWIAPIFLIRFMRTNKWIMAVVLGFIILQTAIFIGLMPLMDMADSTSVKMDTMNILIMQLKTGMLLIAVFFLIPFIIDKALYKRVPKSVVTLVYPSAVVTIELLVSLLVGTLNAFGESQFALPSLVMTTSLFGVFGLSFIVAWFASMLNQLWEEKWELKRLGYPGLVYISIMITLLVYSGISTAFPKDSEETVPVAGITLDNDFYKSMADSDLYLDEIMDLNPVEYAELANSPQSYLDEMRQKTVQAIEAGSKIIVWQEFAVTIDAARADAYLEEMRELADKEDVYLLISYARILSEKERKDQAEKNLGVLFTPEGEKAWEYAKAFPGPGFEDLMVEAGPKEIPYIDTPYGRIGQVICVDMLLPHYLKQASEKDIDILFAPSFDAPIFTPFINYSSAYRAVENGFTMVRVTGLDGQSSVIDPYYRQWGSQNMIREEAKNFYVNVPMISRKTFYGKVGFVFPYVVVVGLISLVGLAVWKRVKKK